MSKLIPSLNKIVAFLSGLFSSEPVLMAIARRYTDANGNYIGELYMHEHSAPTYRMIGVSLDSLPLDIMDPMTHTDYERSNFSLDTGHDFLAPMPPNTVRVGSLDPVENDAVRARVARLPRRKMLLTVQNRFIERVLGR